MRNIEIRRLRALIAVAEELNYRKAALRLHVAQPALSRQFNTSSWSWVRS